MQAFEITFQRSAVSQKERLFPDRLWDDFAVEMEPFPGISDSILYVEDDASVSPSELMQQVVGKDYKESAQKEQLILTPATRKDAENESEVSEEEEDFETETDTDASASEPDEGEEE